MLRYFMEEDLRKQFKIHSTIAGVLLLFVGLISIFLPELTTLTISFIVGWLLVIGGLISAYHVVKSYNTKWIAWTKPFLLFSIGALLLYSPLTGAAAVGLLIIVYFLFDGFTGIILGLEFKPMKGWTMMLFNGVVSFLIAIIFLVGWPISSIWFVGLLVGISLIIDGVAMITIGSSINKNNF